MQRWSNIGGQPFVLTTWTTDAQIKEAVEFVKWWLSPEIQHQFAAAGGQSAIKAVYEDPKYVTYRPWNRAWAPQLDWQKDVWHVPQFFELLTQQQISSTLPSPASRTPRPRWITSPSSSRTC